MKLPFGLKRKIKLPELTFGAQPIGIKDIVAPASVEITQGYLKMGERLTKSFFVFSFPRYLSTIWMSPVINLDTPLDIALYIHPADVSTVLRQLRKRVTEVQSEIVDREEKGLVRDPELETAYKDMEELRDKLQTAQEKMFHLGVYITIYGDSEEQLRDIETELRSILEARLVYIKPALFQQREGFITTAPYGLDRLQIYTPMNTAPLSSIFPFISFDLSSNEGILYGVNKHNNSLILFDRFSLENANEVVFGKAGGGKTQRGNTPVLIKDKGEVQLVKIGPLIEKLAKQYGTVPVDKEIEGVMFPPRLEVYSFNKKLEGEWSRVTVAMRKKAQKVYYIVKTRRGREITTTKDHNMVILKKGKIAVAKTSEIKAGEFIPLPRMVDINEKGKNSIRVSVRKQKIDVPLTNKFLKLAGLITAGGTVSRNKRRKDSYLLDISNTDPEILRLITSALRELGVLFSRVKDKKRQRIRAIRTYQRDFVEMIITLAGEGKSAQKKVWPFLFSLGKKQIAQYLSAYFEGDGGVEQDQGTISAVSKSKRLISEITYLLYYFGIIARIAKAKERAANSNERRKKTHWKVSISGQENLRRFAKEINFISERKRKQLAEIINKNGDPNVDLIPGLAPVIEEMYHLFPPLFWGLPEIMEWKNRKRNPSPQDLNRVVAELETRIRKFKDKAATYKVLSELPRLSNIIASGRNDRLLDKRLWQALDHRWQGVTNERIRPGSRNAFKIIETVSGETYNLKDVKQTIRSGFKEMDLPIKHCDRSLQSALVDRPEGNTSYKMIQKAAQFVGQNYQEILTDRIPQIEQKLQQLKTLANSDLFWDEIIEIKKIKNKKDKYVYDLTVDNEVFLAGEGGMFVHNSYAVKLELLRSLMMNVSVIVVDPENEYEFLSDAVGGSFLSISLGSPNHINPFDLPLPRKGERAEDILRANIINLVGLLRIMLGGLTPEEDAIIDQALTETYAVKDITAETDPALWPEKVPLFSDMEDVLETMEGAEGLVRRLRKFTKGTYAGFFNQPTNVSMDKDLVVFGIRDMEESLRPMAMYIIMRYIWNAIRAELKKRIMVIDEAWWLMQSEDGASFLYGLAKRARKYWLGVTTITQDVIDFLKSDYGKPIITNSSLQLLMKQSTAAADIIQKTFDLTEAEKRLLVEAPVGEGLFFAGAKHVALRVMASYAEDQIITTAPEEVVKIQRAKKELTGP